MGKTVTITNSLSPCACFCYCLDLNVRGIRGGKTSERDSAETSLQEYHQTCTNASRGRRLGCGGRFGEVPTYSRSQTNPSVECVPADIRTWQLSLTRKVTCHSPPLCSNTNTDSGVLVPDIFNYRVSTFISSHLRRYSWIDAFLLSYSAHSCTSEGGRRRRGRSQLFHLTFM